MWPVLVELGGIPIRAYAVCVLLSMVLAGQVRRLETARIGQSTWPGARWVSAGALVGAVIGSKLGMVMFEPSGAWVEHLTRALSLDFSGRTVVGGLIGGYLGVELSKRAVGITRSTGDGWAVALPLAQGIGRIGCLLHGCCYGVVTEAPWGVAMHGATRVPVQAMEAGLDLALAGSLWALRHRPRPEGHLFRRYLVGYAAIRFVCEFFRGDPSRSVGPFSVVQLVCLGALLLFGTLILRGERRLAAG